MTWALQCKPAHLPIQATVAVRQYGVRQGCRGTSRTNEVFVCTVCLYDTMTRATALSNLDSIPLREPAISLAFRPSQQSQPPRCQEAEGKVVTRLPQMSALEAQTTIPKEEDDTDQVRRQRHNRISDAVGENGGMSEEEIEITGLQKVLSAVSGSLLTSVLGMRALHQAI